MESVWNMHINNQYTRHGELNLQELFVLKDCTAKVLNKQNEIPDILDSIVGYVQQSEEPDKDLDICCDRPYECAYKKYCHRNIEEPSVFSIHRLSAEKKYELYHEGIISYADIMRGQPKLSEKQYQQVESAYKNQPPKVDCGKMQLYPDLAGHLMNIHDHMKDLMVPFQQQAYYCKELQGSYSIKWVLPALCTGDPELDYHTLDGVHNGSEAMAAFADLPKHTPDEIAVIRKNLLAYCRLDTLAMVKILGKLYEMV